MKTDRASGVAAAWLPGAQFRERHSAPISGAPEAILDAIAELDDRDDALIRVMLQIREAPSRIWGALGGRSGLKGRARFGLQDFVLLDRSDGVLALGLCGRFWQLDFGLVPMADAAAFRALDTAGVAKLIMIYALSPRDDGQLDLVTETHVHCPDRKSLLFFTPYWAAIRLGSGLIRRRVLAMARKKMDQAAMSQTNSA